MNADDIILIRFCASQEEGGTISRKELADYLGCTEKSIRNWEEGRSKPRKIYREKLMVLVKALDKRNGHTLLSSCMSKENKRTDTATLRKGLKMSQARFARLLGVAHTTVRAWEGGAEPSPEMLEKLEKIQNYLEKNHG